MNKYGKKCKGAGKANIKKAAVSFGKSEKIFHSGIRQKQKYEQIESELTPWEIKRYLINFGKEIYDSLDDTNSMLEASRNIPFKELQELFSILDSKERLAEKFEEYERYIKENIQDIRTYKDLEKIKRMFRLG